MSTATAVDYRDEDFARTVATFYVDIDAADLNAMQQDGATAIVDLAGEYEAMGCSVNTALKAKVLGRLSDIQVRDFALGCHSDVPAVETETLPSCQSHVPSSPSRSPRFSPGLPRLKRRPRAPPPRPVSPWIR